jgi:hypothetical protein
MRTLPVGIGGGLTGAFRAYCYATDRPGDAVYIMGDKVGSTYQVTRVDIDDSDPVVAIAVGVIHSKQSPALCTVRVSGELDGVYTGLPPGRLVFVGTDGRLTVTPPARPLAGTRVLNAVGYTLASGAIMVRVASPARLQSA